jgi:alkylation response protein AidB-like acyl-CoA dehydrogenase
MNFDYSQEQRQLMQEARRFLDDRCPAARVRAVLARAREDGTRSYDEVLWKSVAELGWLGTTIPERYGGLGLGYVELCALAEELGRALAPIPFSSTKYFLAEILMLAGSEGQREQWLPQISRGELIGCLATSEGPGLPAGTSSYVESGCLVGTKIPVTDGDVAQVAVVLASEAGLPGLFMVELSDPAVSRSVLESLDGTRGLARLSFAGARAERLGGAGEGLRLLDQLLCRAVVPLAFEQVGGADRCLESACEHARHRYAFGRPVGSYQAIKHRLADMYVKNQLARSNAYYAAWALAAGMAELPLAAATAHLAAAEAFVFAAQENIHVHGGMGFTWEADAQLYFRRARHLSLIAGSPAAWSERLVEALLSGCVAAGVH